MSFHLNEQSIESIVLETIDDIIATCKWEERGKEKNAQEPTIACSSVGVADGEIVTGVDE